jgi:16S rRNA (cytidine1402-2'-O)-methyltransferase
VTAALAASGIPSRSFTFLGFLSRRAGPRRRLLRSFDGRDETLVVFEAPHRLRETLADMRAELGDRPIVACRELTKMHEEVFRGRISEALAHFLEPRGEFTLVVAGTTDEEAPEEHGQREIEAAVIEEMRRLRDEGRGAQEALRLLSQRHGLSRRRLYRLWLELR